MKINVTAKDIKEGSRSRARLCPVARAIQRRLNPPWTAHVAGSRVELSLFGCVHSVKLPNAVSLFVSKFDRQGRRWVKPFTFVMEIPADARVRKD